MILRASAVVAIACLAGPAHAERAVHVVARGTPFAAGELETALRVRLAAAGGDLVVQVIGVGDRVDVAIGDTTREVELGGRTGTDAARLVALTIVDLALDDLAVVPHRASPRLDVTFDLLGSATVWTGVLAGGSADVAIARGRWLGAIEVTGSEDVTGALRVASTPVRVCAGMRSDQIELRAGLAIAPTWVTNGDGDQVTNLGVTGSARLRLAVAHGVRFVAAVGADAYATQTTYTLGSTMIATPWVAPWVAAGMELTP